MTVIAASVQTVAAGAASTPWSPSGASMVFDLDNDAIGYLESTRASADSTWKPLTISGVGRDGQQLIKGPSSIYVATVAGRQYRFTCTKAATGGGGAAIAADQ